MKKFKFLSFILLFSLFVCSMLPSASALEPVEIDSNAAMVVDLDTGKTFYEKNADMRVYPASVTKIMTVLLAIEAIERGDVSIYDEITAADSMSYDLVADGSSAGILVGETMSLESYLYCAMVSSANEACNVIAEYIGGTIPLFIESMNRRAAELGCTGTSFANTHGLPDENHYTTARDFSLIVQEAAHHDLFMEICGTPTVTIPATNKCAERKLNNSNALICSDSIYGSGYLYEYARGIKTGHTSDAGYCLASTAEKDGISLLAVVFGGKMYTDGSGKAVYTNFTDTIKLYDWVFNNFSYQEILSSVVAVAETPVAMGSDADSVSLRPESSVTALLPNDFSASDVETKVTVYSEQSGEQLTAPISAGQVLGEVSVSIGGTSYCTVKLVALSTVSLSHRQYIKSEISKTLHSTPVKIVIIVLAVLLVGYVALVVRYRILHERHRRALREARRAAAGKPSAAAPKTPDAPPIDYFTADAAVPEKPKAEPQPSPESADDKAKAERDYFEEFFRQK